MENQETHIGGCLPRIRSIYKALTKAEQKVADYILENAAKVVHLSITELAEVSGSAEATIFRLCQKVGYRGYQHFKIALAGDLYTPAELVYKDVNAGDSMGVIARKVFHDINEGLQDTLKIIDEAALDKAVAAITKARRIDAYGSAGSAVIAADIEYRFMRFGIPVRAYADPHMQIISAALMQPGDLAIAVSHTGANRDLLDSVAMAKQNGATVIAITSYMKSPLSKLADITLCGSAKETEYRSEAMAARLVHLAIVDALYVGVMLDRQDCIVENMEKIRKAIAIRRV
ncbi:transcriptional regulator, RpiR family [Thermosinus carboxydivorans Nor1]|uniref:Transcriptional regulator, RpiR family n=1 Tax=Thermosinus carboxydivorans Nor1 TaxID=401526 RepID=A1HSQ6_9FIRM|nr:MurR/RpiR family transcriptional regulator [Thermosinus carboxydivorans]EAX46937.1 transcriptional regulator, RpiR family [Thermosinus carboxydivorans Nor1]